MGLTTAFLISGCDGGTTPDEHPPNTPSNPNPTNNAVDQAVDVTLTWDCSDPDGGSLRYDVFFSIAPSSPTLVSDNQSGKSYTPPEPLWYATTYNWRIKATDPEGNFNFGPMWSFSTEYGSGPMPPYEPTDPSPEDDAENVSLNPTLSWVGGDPNGDPVTYDLYFGISPSPVLLVEDQSSLSYGISGLEESTRYYWKIVAKAEGDETEGPVWTFTTGEFDVVFSGSKPIWSPDGQKLAFGVAGVNQGIWVYDHNNGTGPWQITNQNYPHLYDYSWSSGSDQIAFGGAGAPIDTTSGIWVVDASGSEAPVRWHETGHSPRWIPDGSGLIFVEEDAVGGNYGLYRLTFSTGTVSQITAEGVDPKIDPGGDRIAYRVPGSGAAFQLKVAPINGGIATVLSDSCANYDWTADGETIVFDFLTTQSGYLMYTIPAEGGDRDFLTSYASEPTVSATGLVAFTKVYGADSEGIYTINLDGSNYQQRTSSGFQPSINSNGTFIAYAKADGIYLVNL
jgi:Tol biopolymer transport system component